ncbi:MAG: hypothetical protein EOM40_03950 [Clostridia bacterium]|nr:hypothetical protein [Clostridia bacterium]NCC43957.1 hypothetical protein [Clostridia bacterium]
MISFPLLKQTVKSNWVIWGAMAGISAILLAQFAAMEMTQNLLFVIFYSIMVTLFPAVYSLICSNKLMAGQVDSGSMAYVLSTPTSRGKVVRTQMVFSVVSTCLIFAFNAVVHIAVNASSPLAIATATGGSVMVEGDLTAKMILLTNLSACLASLALAGLCFMFSGIFNRSKYVIGFSGTLVGVCILAGMMGTFGSLGIDSLENFKYATLFTLYDYASVLSSGEDWIIKAVVAGVIALVGYFVGGAWFCKKDLPL